MSEKSDHVEKTERAIKPWYKKWWGVLVVICIWPFFLIWYAWAKSRWSQGGKIAATVVGGLGVIFSLATTASSPQPSTTTTTHSTTQQAAQPTKQAAPAAAPTPAPAPTPAVPTEYKSALNQADTYANTMHLSKQGVYDQLVSQYGGQFSAAAAQYAIDNVTADWNANALATAKNYQSQQSLSPSAIHDQLISSYGDKFTEAEADYAIQHLND